MKKAKSDYLIQSVSRALDILEAFTASEGELGVTELSRRLKLHKNNVFRLLATLETRGYVEQDRESGNYRLGMKTFEVASVFLHHLGLVTPGPARPRAARPGDRRDGLSRRAGRALGRVCRHGGHGSAGPGRLASRAAAARPRRRARQGAARLPVPRGAARSSGSARRPRARRGRTIVDPSRLGRGAGPRGRARVGRWRTRSIEPGVRGLAAPVRDYARRVVGAIGVRGPAFRLPAERLETEVAPRVRAAARDVSKRLGFAVVAD